MKKWIFNHNRLTVAREVKDLTQSELGKLTGFTQSQLSMWESGKIIPGAANVATICNALSCPPKFFYTHADDEIITCSDTE